MIAQLIGTLIRNLPAVLFVLALIIPLLYRHGPVIERFLSWILLLPIGITGLGRYLSPLLSYDRRGLHRMGSQSVPV